MVARTKDDDTSSSITTFFILRPTKLDHVLCCRVCNIDFTKDSISVVGETVKKYILAVKDT